MARNGDVETLDSGRLLNEWRWLCPQPLSVIGRNAFGDLFLKDEAGKVHLLNVGAGEFGLIAASVSEFTELARTSEKKEVWFAETAVNEATSRGLVPGPQQCIGFSTPVVFAENNSLDAAYIADLYEHVGFLGDIHRQIAMQPDGAKVRLVVQTAKPKPEQNFG
jgi:hypothetical protein